MNTQHTHYDLPQDVYVIFENGDGVVLENIEDIYLDDYGHFVHFRDSLGDEMVVSFWKIKYYRPNSIPKDI